MKRFFVVWGATWLAILVTFALVVACSMGYETGMAWTAWMMRDQQDTLLLVLSVSLAVSMFLTMGVLESE